MEQEQKLALRLKQVLEMPGLHEIVVYVTPDKKIQFWVVDTKPVEGVVKCEQNNRTGEIPQ